MIVPMVRIESDGTVTDGTCEFDGRHWLDFRDLDGEPLILQPGARFQIVVDSDGEPT